MMFHNVICLFLSSKHWMTRRGKPFTSSFTESFANITTVYSSSCHQETCIIASYCIIKQSSTWLMIHPRKFNIGPEKWWLEEYFPQKGWSLFQGRTVKLQRCPSLRRRWRNYRVASDSPDGSYADENKKHLGWTVGGWLLDWLGWWLWKIKISKFKNRHCFAVSWCSAL